MLDLPRLEPPALIQGALRAEPDEDLAICADLCDDAEEEATRVPHRSESTKFLGLNSAQNARDEKPLEEVLAEEVAAS